MFKGHKLIFNKYRLKSLIHSSNLGKLYEGINEKENTPVAIKMEKRNKNSNILESEAYFLMNLRGYGIPKIITYGHHGLYNVLIEELLGLSIEKLLSSRRAKKFNLKDICMLALQALDRLEFIHSKLVIHRDIKPSNFAIGRKEPELIYLIDFGLSRKYKSSRTGKHIQFLNKKLIYGSAIFLSINGNKGYEQSRRDDLESLGYMLIYLANGGIPWYYITNLNISIQKKFFLTYKMKNSITTEALCKGLPKEIVTYLNYCKKLYFEQDPDYNYLRSLFYVILFQINQKNDLKFYWIAQKIYNKIKKKNMSQKKQRKTSASPHVRLLNKIKNTLINSKSPNHSCFKSKNKSSYSFVNISLSFIYKDNKYNNNNEKELVSGDYEVSDKYKGVTTNQSSPEKYIKRMSKNSNFYKTKIQRNESSINKNKNNIYFEQRPKNISKSPLNIKNINLCEKEKNNVFNDTERDYPEYFHKEFRNLNNNIITNLNDNSKNIVKNKNVEEYFNKEINEQNKTKKLTRKNRFITNNSFWDNNTGGLIEDNWNERAFGSENNKLNQFIGQKIINNNNIFKNKANSHIKNIYKNKNLIQGNINELKQIISDRKINSSKKNFQSILLNNSVKNFHIKSEIKNMYLNKNHNTNNFKGINQELNVIKKDNLLDYKNQYKYKI